VLRHSPTPGHSLPPLLSARHMRRSQTDSDDYDNYYATNVNKFAPRFPQYLDKPGQSSNNPVELGDAEGGVKDDRRSTCGK
jgi:hypothetical protein